MLSAISAHKVLKKKKKKAKQNKTKQKTVCDILTISVVTWKNTRDHVLSDGKHDFSIIFCKMHQQHGNINCTVKCQGHLNDIFKMIMIS